MKLNLIPRLLILSIIVFLVSCSSDDDNGSESNQDSSTSSSREACNVFNFARQKIANGQVCTQSGQNSPLVRLGIDSLQGSGVCTGAIIDNDKVVTAAHCLEGTILGVTIETTAGNKSGSRYIIPRTYRDENTSQGPVSFDDIAIVISSEPFGISPMPFLITQNPQIGETSFVGGYGENAPGVLDRLPRAGNAIIIDVNPNHVTIDFESDQAHPCRGDSGGPLVVKRGDVGAIVGVVSQSAPTVPFDLICRPGDRTLYTHVRGESVLRFLSDHAPDSGAL